MKLIGAAITELRMRLAAPLSTPRGNLRERKGFVLTLTSESGAGVGEASPAYWVGGEPLTQARRSLDRIVRRVAGHPDSDDLRELLAGRGRRGGPIDHAELSPAAACALDTALLDLIARQRGVAVASLLGGQAQARLPVCALIAGATAEALAQRAEAAVARGFRVLKIKVGGGPIDDDLKRINAAGRRLGPAVSLRLDANRAWTLADAIRALAKFSRFPIEYVEEPLASPTPHKLAELRATTRLALALDESITDPDALAEYAARQALDVVVLKAARLGGPTGGLQIARLAAAAGIKTAVTDSIESAVGTSTALHLAAALPRPYLAAGLGGLSLLADHGCGRAHRLSPWLRPRGPGLGVP